MPLSGRASNLDLSGRFLVSQDLDDSSWTGHLHAQETTVRYGVKGVEETSSENGIVGVWDVYDIKSDIFYSSK